MNDLATQESPPSSTPLQTGQLKAVYTIIERPGHEKKLWLRIGTPNCVPGQNGRAPATMVAVRGLLTA